MNALYNVSYDREWTWIKFPGGKPAESVLAALRSFARFSNRRVAWYITSHLDESDIARRLSVSTPEPAAPACELVIDLLAQDVTPAPALPQLPAPVAPAPTTETERARAWFDSIDLEAIPAEDHVTAEFWKNTVAVFRYKEALRNGDRFSLYTRNPQQKQHRWTATHRGHGNTLNELRDGFEHFITEMEAKQARADARRDAKRQARAAFVNPYKVGDFLYSHWGYDQTNVETYQVMEVRPTSLQIRRTAQGHEATGYDSWRCWPLKDQFTEPSQWVTIIIDENGNHGVPSPIHGGLYLWDGKPLHASDGH